ncbi:MAG: alpha/beta hydrolase [Acidobacteriota bacterium]
MRLLQLLVLALVLTPSLLAADRVPVAPGVELHYVEAGEGAPMVFVPGWTMTSDLFRAQIEAFSDNHRVLSFDPRSHGKSTKVGEGNTYAQHGRDLGALLDQLGLDEVVLIGWSSGCHDVLAYVREYGVAKLRGVVLVDEPPKAVGDPEAEWVYGDFDDYRGTLESLLYRRRESAEGLARWMTARDLEEEELRWVVDQSLATPTEAALSLMVDTMLLDYTAEARSLDGRVPVLFMVREGWVDTARAWIEKSIPAAQVEVLSSHAEHWERPREFNRKLRKFLDSIDLPSQWGGERSSRSGPPPAQSD